MLNDLRDTFGFKIPEIFPGPTYPAILKDGNTVAWYLSDESSTITKDGADRVSRWNDFLGSGHDLLQAVGGDQPLWGVNGVLFDGVSEFMQAVFVLNQPEQIYIVFRQVTWSANDRVFEGGALANSGGLIQNAVTPELTSLAGLLSTPDGSLPLNTFGIVRILFNGANSTFQINEFSKWTGDAGAGNMGGLSLAVRGTGGTQFGNIEEKEIILRSIIDTTPNNQDIYNYLSAKYGI